MRTLGTNRGSTTGRRTGTTTTRALAGLALAALLLTGCSAGGDSSTAEVGQPAPQDLAGGGAADRGQDAAAGAGEAGGDAAADAGADAGAAADAGTAAGADAAATGTIPAGTDGRQVVTTGEVGLTAPDPRAAADQVVAETERAGGRVDARQEAAARAEEGTEATADLTVRVPADAVTGLLAALDEIGEVDHVDLQSDDVTAAAQDLDARIGAMELSVGRMADLLARATTRDEVLAAEGTLTERQASLEQLRSERARLAEQVALSTLRVSIWAPAAPVAEEVAPEPEPAPRGFLGGLEAGWDALVGVLGGVVLVLGVLLPWLALGGLVAGGVVLVRRRWRGRSAAAGGPGSGPAGGPAAGPGSGGGPGADGGAGPDEPVDPAGDPARTPVGAGAPRG